MKPATYLSHVHLFAHVTPAADAAFAGADAESAEPAGDSGNSTQPQFLQVRVFLGQRLAIISSIIIL